MTGPDDSCPLPTEASHCGGDQCSEHGVVRTGRLSLNPMSCELMRAILSKDWAAAERLLGTEFPNEWRQDGWRWLAPRVADGERDPRLLQWGTRVARRTAARRSGCGPVIAEVGFHGPPDASGWVEIGYRVVARYRRLGFAEEAASGLLSWAAQHGLAGIRASVSPGNAASIGLLGKLGFVESGAYRHAVLGEQLTFRRVADRTS